MGLGVHGTSQRPAPAHVFDLVCLSWCLPFWRFSEGDVQFLDLAKFSMC